MYFKFQLTLFLLNILSLPDILIVHSHQNGSYKVCRPCEGLAYRSETSSGRLGQVLVSTFGKTKPAWQKKKLEYPVPQRPDLVVMTICTDKL